MKGKGTIKFIFSLIIILILYFGVIFHIDNFTLSYHEKLESYINPYYQANQQTNILDAIELCSANEELTEKNIEVIKNSKVIRNILYQAAHIEENQLDKYIQHLKKEDKIRVVQLNYRILYINDTNYQLAFSLDTNNILYRSVKTSSQSVGLWKVQEITVQNKNEIYEKVKKQLKIRKITEKFVFEPQIFYLKSYDEKIGNSGMVYVIEDTKNHIRVEYEMVSDEILNLQIGFENFIIKV